jgi:hypothetical protein
MEFSRLEISRKKEGFLLPVLSPDPDSMERGDLPDDHERPWSEEAEKWQGHRNPIVDFQERVDRIRMPRV